MSKKYTTDVISPTADGTTAIQITKADGTTNILNIDSTNERVGVGTATPACEFEVDGYAKLGSGAPEIKMKKLTGTTAATQGNPVSIAHGLTMSKIISWTVQVESDAPNLVQANYVRSVGYKFHNYVDATNFVVLLHSTEAANITSAPIIITVWYEE